MKKKLRILIVLFVLNIILPSCAKQEGKQYFILNTYHSNYYYENIAETFGPQKDQKLAVGNGILIYMFEYSMDYYIAMLKKHFEMAEQYDIPVLVQLDPISFWNDVPELWNWFDPSKPGYDPANRENVEWYDWGPENAIKLGWLNWGSQIRLAPMANLFSPKYQEAVKERMDEFLKVTYEWYKSLPRSRKYLLCGIKLTGELGFEINNWYYPNGNNYYDQPASEDPVYGLDKEQMPFRGVGPMGYASLTYSGIKTEGEITPEDIYRLEWEYSKWIADIAQGYGFGREMLFNHSGGWKDDLAAPVQSNTCPSWSLYWDDGRLPQNSDAFKYLETSDAPYWAASEWNMFTDDYDKWSEAISNCFGDPRCRFVSLYNYDSIFKRDGSLAEGPVKALKEYQETVNNR